MIDGTKAGREEGSRLRRLRETARSSSGSALLALVLANLVPCALVFWGGWLVADLVVLYFAETVALIAITFLQLLVLPRDWTVYEAGEEPLIVNGRMVPPRQKLKYYILLYGLYVVVVGFFVYGFFGVRSSSSPSQFGWALGALAASHGISLVLNFFARGERSTVRTDTLMRKPLQRCLLLQVFVLGSGVLVAFMPVFNSRLALALFIGLKIAFDLRAHRAEHASILIT